MLDRAKKTPLLGTVNEQWGWEIKITCDYLILMDEYIVYFSNFIFIGYEKYRSQDLC